MKICSKLARQLEVVNAEPSSDRLYINTAFFVLFPEKYIKKQVKKGLSREEALKIFRDSARYDTMKGMNYISWFRFVFTFFFDNFNLQLGWWQTNHHVVFVLDHKNLLFNSNVFTDLYDLRVLSNGKDNVAARLKMFKLVFRSKLNNWWLANAHKIKVKTQPVIDA